MEMHRRTFLQWLWSAIVMFFLTACGDHSGKGGGGGGGATPTAQVDVNQGQSILTAFRRNGNISVDTASSQGGVNGRIITSVNGQHQNNIEITENGNLLLLGSTLSNGDSFSGTVAHTFNNPGQTTLVAQGRGGAVIGESVTAVNIN